MMEQGMRMFIILTCLMLTLTAKAIQAEERGNELARVSVHSTLTELNDFRPGYIYLVVENKTDTLLTVDRIEIAEYPDFIDIRKSSLDTTVVSRKKPVLVYPDKDTVNVGASGIYELFIEASDQLKPGKHLLLFNVLYHGWVPVETQQDTLSVIVRHPMTGSTTKTHEVEVKVFGEGEILGALSNAVTFLMMPGFIMVIVFAMAWKISAPAPYKEKLPGWLKEAKIIDLQFWVIAITMSLIMARWLYPILTELFSSGRRNYLYGYGFYDIVMMWWFSVLMGALSGLIAGGGVSLYRRISYRKAIHGNENPLEFLQKAVALGVKEAWLKKTTLKESGKSGYLIEEDDIKKESLWVIPRVHVLWQASADELYARFEDKIFDDKAILSDVLNTLVDGKKEGHEGKGLQGIEWEKSSHYIEKPLAVKKANLDSLKERENIFSSTMTGQ